ncbi:MAG: glycosyltransferase family 2 protein [Spirochaetales bacterium]|nr:glycosyltransferase family 2 protein [Spirochaetales bacterium]
MKKYVSVIIVTHDRDISFITGALNSVMGQSYTPEEIIIVDSDDEKHFKSVKEALSGFEFKDIEHTLVWVENTKGPKARNEGASIAKGEYISFLDDDDEWYPRKLESQISAINDGNRWDIRYITPNRTSINNRIAESKRLSITTPIIF